MASKNAVIPSTETFVRVLENDFRRSFPNGFFSSKFSSGSLGNVVYIQTSLLPRGAQSNGIIENDPSYSTFWIYGDKGQDAFSGPRPDVRIMAPKLKVEMSQGGRLAGPNVTKVEKTGWRNGTGTPDNILKKFNVYFKNLRSMVDARDDIRLIKSENPMKNSRTNPHYQINEWVLFEVDGMAEGIAQDEDEFDLSTFESEMSEALEKAQARFTKEANRVVRGWIKKNPKKAVQLLESDDVESDDDIAWNTWASLEGHGVGFWENMSREDYASLEKAIKSDKKLEKARSTLENEINDAAYRGFGEREENPRQMTKAQFEAMFKEEYIPAIIKAYEQDGIPDRPARREEWNNAVDFYLKEGELPKSAENWGHPKWLETYKPKKGNPTDLRNDSKIKNRVLR